MNLFPRLDPTVAMEACPHLKAMLDDLERVARILIEPPRP